MSAPQKKKGLNWKAIAIIIVALLAMLAYVLSLDESVEPGSDAPTQQGQPADLPAPAE